MSMVADIGLECEACDNCEVIYASVCHDSEGKSREWSCVGLMKEPRREDNIHDIVNRIRICIENPNSETGLTLFEWTPWEASAIQLLLSMGVTQYLSQGQPINHIIEELKKKGLSDDQNWDGKTE